MARTAQNCNSVNNKLKAAMSRSSSAALAILVAACCWAAAAAAIPMTDGGGSVGRLVRQRRLAQYNFVPLGFPATPNIANNILDGVGECCA